jgi:hypothetical protein
MGAWWWVVYALVFRGEFPFCVGGGISLFGINLIPCHFGSTLVTGRVVIGNAARFVSKVLGA